VKIDSQKSIQVEVEVVVVTFLVHQAVLFLEGGEEVEAATNEGRENLVVTLSV
jgi:hypothetical protein